MKNTESLILSQTSIFTHSGSAKFSRNLFFGKCDKIARSPSNGYYLHQNNTKLKTSKIDYSTYALSMAELPCNSSISFDVIFHNKTSCSVENFAKIKYLHYC